MQSGAADRGGDREVPATRHRFYDSSQTAQWNGAHNRPAQNWGTWHAFEQGLAHMYLPNSKAGLSISTMQQPVFKVHASLGTSPASSQWSQVLGSWLAEHCFSVIVKLFWNQKQHCNDRDNDRETCSCSQDPDIGHCDAASGSRINICIC